MGGLQTGLINVLETKGDEVLNKIETKGNKVIDAVNANHGKINTSLQKVGDFVLAGHDRRSEVASTLTLLSDAVLLLLSTVNLASGFAPQKPPPTARKNHSRLCPASTKPSRHPKRPHGNKRHHFWNMKACRLQVHLSIPSTMATNVQKVRVPPNGFVGSVLILRTPNRRANSHVLGLWEPLCPRTLLRSGMPFSKNSTTKIHLQILQGCKHLSRSSARPIPLHTCCCFKRFGLEQLGSSTKSLATNFAAKITKMAKRISPS